ncbi:MAG: transcription termination factor Rho [Actinobacteria bacterium]|nr:transcription termination factor Rho [Actinomycetota bacterium]
MEDDVPADANELERAALQRKDREQLTAIAAALGRRAPARARKEQLIDLILEAAGVGTTAASPEPAPEQPHIAQRPAPEPEAAPAEERVEEPEEEPASSAGSEESPGEDTTEDGEQAGGGRRRRRRGRDRGAVEGAAGERGGAERGAGERPNGDEQTLPPDAIRVLGLLDLRDEGYGFLRVRGHLPSREDVYVPAKFIRQFSLRKGDVVAGWSRPAGRGEKNPALLRVEEVNDGDPEAARGRLRFDDLTAVHPEERLVLVGPDNADDVTARVIDLLTPMGRGQRGIVVAPPRTGASSLVRSLARAVEVNNPDVTLLVLLVDERPEEVTDVRRVVESEIVAATFDRPADEHVLAADMTIERAKRLVETGHDVVVVVDGITRIARAYNTASPLGSPTYPAKRFLGAARNVAEGGSLTVIATVATGTGTRGDDAVLEDLREGANLELHLDRSLAEQRIHPAVAPDRSSTRHEELLVGAAGADARRRARALSGPDLVALVAATASVDEALGRLP